MSEHLSECRYLVTALKTDCDCGLWVTTDGRRIDPDSQPCAFYSMEGDGYEAIVLFRQMTGKRASRSATQTFRAYSAQGLLDELLDAGWTPDSTSEQIAQMCQSARFPRRSKPRRKRAG